MNHTRVTDGIYRLSSNVEDILFESLWPVPEGMAMNSYIAKGQDIAIIDGVCGWDGVPDTLFDQFSDMGLKVGDIRYAVLTHLEPDHSGWLEPFLKLTRDVEVVATEKGIALARAFYGHVMEHCRCRTVKTGDALDLGHGKVLEFVEIPNVHWPETMAVLDTQTHTLLQSDAFGAFGRIEPGKSFDDELNPAEMDVFEREAIRYFADIVCAYSGAVRNALKKLSGHAIRMIAPGHGIVWRRDPKRMIDLYDWLSGLANGPAEPRITLLWASMYGMTGSVVSDIVAGIESEGVPVDVFKVPETHTGYILPSVLQSQGIVVGTPTYEYEMFPPMAHVLDVIGRKRIRNRNALRFGSFGWSGGAQKELERIMEQHRLKWDFMDPIEFNGAPDDAALHRAREQAAALARKVKAVAVARYPERQPTMPSV